MLKITLQYFPIDFDVAFLRIKQQYIRFTHYKIAFYIHVFFSIFSLLAGFTQFSTKIRVNYARLHKGIGWLYLVSIIVFAAPSGLIIGYYANGGFWSQLAFCLLALGWFWFSLQSLLALTQKKYRKHQIFAIRSFALTLSAITLRLWKYLIVLIFQPRPMDVYQIVAWLGWVLNLIIAEIIIQKYIKK
ncbi:DUF2306 domain-containing protein [Aquimarina algicola]|uniref:DUF2306 domain-containing protein n=1 Tax=Aquimarina algicola TaxID=2589995 RepID=A0A504JN06_9FLAO|nr:DUF2306 domain-containing protein [Aquimarina algicola]TPN87800.1 DUF2306 domain-containing protein [Aquimarina algicola]